MAKLVKSVTNYVLRRKIQNTTLGSIYERDWMTVSEMDWYAKGLLPIWESGNFKMTINPSPTPRKRYSYGNWEDKDGDVFWTLENTDTIEVKVDVAVLKPKYSNITDFAYYGSATELVRASVSDIINKFPGELYFGDRKFQLFNSDTGFSGGKIEGKKVVPSNDSNLYIVENPFGININTEYIRETDIENKDRYFSLSSHKYEVIFHEGENDETRFDVCWTPKNPKNDCPQPYDIVFTVNFEFATVYGVYTEDGIILLHDGSCEGFHIRMKEEYLSEAFDKMDDFERMLLNRESKPRYKVVLDTPVETDFGTLVTRRSYIWPVVDGWNIDISGNAYSSYIEKLLKLCKYYDEYRTDSIWRAMVHESIKNFDWTTPSDTNIPEIDGEEIDSQRITNIMRVYGRQFDDIKRYIEGISATANISYNGENNIQDKILAKMLEMDGWEVKDVAPALDNDIVCSVRYPGKNLYPSPEDGNIEFMRRLALNSRNLLSMKGTVKGLKTMLSLFGIQEIKSRKYNSIDWWKTGNVIETGYTIKEYDVLATQFPSGDTVTEIKAINAKKDRFAEDRTLTEDDYSGLMGAELVLNDGDNTITYLVPWVDKERRYDGDPYFQMFGGWGRRDRRKVNFSAVPDLNYITATTSDITSTVSFPIYDETVKNIRIVQGTENLKYANPSTISSGDVFYCVDIQGYYNEYPDSESDSVSNYFVLNPIGSNIPSIEYSSNLVWQPVFFSDFELIGKTGLSGDDAIRANNAAKVVYLETINDTITGNNPHNGKHYDSGREYFEYFNTIFRADTPDYFSRYNAEINSANLDIAYSNRYNGTSIRPVENIVSGVSTDTRFGFGTIKNNEVNYVEDTQKIWFFFDDNTKDEWVGGIYSRVGTKRDRDGKVVFSTWSGFTESCLDFSEQGDMKSESRPINPDGSYGNTEIATYSVINTKKLVIKFVLSDYYRDYIEDVVEFYLKQMIPSTTLLEFQWQSADKGVGELEGCYSEIFGMVSDDPTVFGVLSDEAGGIPDDGEITINPDLQIVSSTTTSAKFGVKRKKVNKDTIGLVE